MTALAELVLDLVAALEGGVQTGDGIGHEAALGGPTSHDAVGSRKPAVASADALEDLRSAPAGVAVYLLMRILKGIHEGRRLTSPGGPVRPTPEDVRDKCVSVLEADLEDARVLDLFSGSGALGLEALSRGARSVDFVENGPAALHALKANVASLRETKRCRIFKKDVLPWIEKLPPGAYAVCFADPPYGSRKLDRVLERWTEVPFADVLVLEHDAEHKVPGKGKRYDFEGPTRVTIFRA